MDQVSATRNELLARRTQIALTSHARSQPRGRGLPGKGALSDADRRHAAFAEAFERRFVGQGDASRSVGETLDLGWELLAAFSDDELKRVDPDVASRYRAGADRDDDSA